MVNIFPRSPSSLRKAGILGLNQRNESWVMAHNPRRAYPMADDKLLTKKMAIEAGITVPELYGSVSATGELRHIDKLLGPHRDFVIKPVHGSGGSGIIVISGRDGDNYLGIDGTPYDSGALRSHIAHILSGLYSLGGQPDSAMIEYRVRFSRIFEHLAYKGVPDIRTIVFRGIPIMSMLRLPTRKSHGKANLHQGAVGVGVDMATGMTIGGVSSNTRISEHPDTGAALAGHMIPDWDTILEISSRCYNLTELGYLGVDIVLDEGLGPMVLEINARPGLNIQIANNCGIAKRLEAVRALRELPTETADRIALAKQMFAV
ncbi:MAG: alpha-L-glutamate ligase-like protein [bacterium]|nr:alpha-L-glutamate ligase-like protein [bacterium]